RRLPAAARGGTACPAPRAGQQPATRGRDVPDPGAADRVRG
ncbi:hypothetical protein SM139_2211, partial [Stenotrophomonas maltophilia]